MPTIEWFGARVRVRPMLDAISAQADLEEQGERRAGHLCRSPACDRAWDRERSALARRRNATEARLRPEEHAAWDRWRAADTATRAAGYAVLVDLPTPLTAR